MPGIYGHVITNNVKSSIEKMSSILMYQDHFHRDSDFQDDFVCISHIHLGNMKCHSDLFFRNGIYIFIEGEQYDIQEQTFEEFLFNSYIDGTIENKLNSLDGYFNAVIYDSRKKKLFLISDRYGMRSLYYYSKDGQFAWSGEVKGLLPLISVDKTINSYAFDCFMDLGYLTGNMTWFKHIQLIEPASIIEYDIQSRDLSQRYYWKWSEIDSNEMSFEEAVDQTSTMFLRSIEKRFQSSSRIGIALSGGLDSRFILAAVRFLYPEYKGYLYTYGQNGCDDVLIAKMAAEKTDWEHDVFYFTEHNWFKPRIEKIWHTDGMLNMMHMHGCEFLETISRKIDYNLNGYLGDQLLGASYLNNCDELFNKKLSNHIASLFYGRHLYQKPNMEFYNINRLDPFLTMTRGRRFINMGTVNVLNRLDQRKPFYDNKLIEFVYSVPDEYRKHNRLYTAVLLKYFPDFFKNIPWQKTRKTIDDRKSQFLQSNNVIRRPLEYARAIRTKTVLDTIKELLNFEDSYYQRFTNQNMIDVYLTPHLNDTMQNHVDKIFRAATIEQYFRHVNKHGFI